MTLKLFFLVLVLGIGSACASTEPKRQSQKLDQSVIVERSAVPPFSGYLRTYVRFKIKASGSELEVFYPYFEDGKRLPEVGEVCDLTYHTELVDGHVGDNPTKIQDAKVIDSLECKKSA